MSANNNVVPARPSISTMVPLSKVTKVGDALEHPELRERLASALPRHMSPERMLRTFHIALQRTPDLAKADMRELLGALIGFAAIGIEPNTPLGHGWLIPYGKREKIDGEWKTTGVTIQPIVGYKGYIDLARRTGTMRSLHADVVYTGDPFDYQYGTEEYLRHKYGNRAGPVLSPEYAYAVAKLEDGYQFEVLPWADVLRIRDGSQAYTQAKQRGGNALAKTPWQAHLDAMARKTGVRRLSKMLPMSIEMSTAAMIDESGEGRGVRFANLLEASPSEVNGQTIDGYIEQGDDEVMEATSEPYREPERQQQPAKPAQAAKPQPAAPKAAAKPAPKAAPEPEPEDQGYHNDDPGHGETQAAAEPEQQVIVYRVLTADGEVYATSEDVQIILENVSDLLASTDSGDALMEVSKNNRPLHEILPPDAQKLYQGMFGDRRAELLAEAEADADAETANDGGSTEPDAPAANFAVDAAALKAADGTMNSMAVGKALDDMSKTCSTPADWTAFEQQNAALLEFLTNKARSLAKSMEIRIEKGKAG